MADINRNEEKVPAPEEIHGLAAALDQFGADFDPYEYMDTVEDKEQNIRDTEAMLLAGKTDGLKNYLLGFIDDDRDPQAVQALSLIHIWPATGTFWRSVLVSLPRSWVTSRTVTPVRGFCSLEIKSFPLSISSPRIRSCTRL